MSGVVAFAVWLSLTAAKAAPTAAAGVAPPTAVAGTWDVVRVAVDAQDAQHWGYHPDDPRLLGRSLLISADRVQFAHGKRLGCAPSAWPSRKATWGELIGKGFPRPAMGGRSGTPAPDDFGLKKPKKQSATAYSLCPGVGGRFPADHWVVAAGSELALHYDNQVLLLMRRRSPDARPLASFDCAKAATVTEKVICGDFDLASLDRSVAQAFREALARSADKEQHLHQSQKEWLKERDACGARVECIYDQEWGRVDELTQE